MIYIAVTAMYGLNYLNRKVKGGMVCMPSESDCT